MTNILETWNRDGVVYPIEVFSEDEIDHYRSVLEYEVDHNHILENEHRCKSLVLFPWMDVIVHNEIILDAVQEVLGPNFFCWDTQCWLKEPGDKRYVSWHQDATHWNFDKKNGVIVWLAFDDVDSSMGPVEYKLGSHKHGQIEHTDLPTEFNILRRGQTLTGNYTDHGSSTMTIKKGHAGMHHPYVVHGSGPNEGTRRRIGYSLQYISTDNKPIVTECPEYATLVRGMDEFNYINHSPRPSGNMTTDLVNWEIAHRTQRTNYLKVNR